MPSTYSPSLGLELMGAGDQAGNWGNTTNTNLGSLIEQAITGVETIGVSNNPATPTTLVIGTGTLGTQSARNAVLVLDGTLSDNRNLIVPTVNKFYAIRNATSGGFSVVVKTAAGSGVTLANGLTQLMYCNGTNVVAATQPFDSVNGNLFLSGNVTINKANPTILLTKTATTGQNNLIAGQTNGLSRWDVLLGNEDNESGSNAGSNLKIHSRDDAGVYIETPLSITRATGETTLKTLSVTGNATVTGNSTIAGTLVPSSSFLRNRIINGQQQVDQRNNGTTVSIASGSFSYVTDRNGVYNAGPNAVTAERVAGASGFQYAIRITGSASNTATSWYQRIEAINSFDMASVSVTFSAFVWADSNRNVTPAVSTPNTYENFAAQTVGGSTTWAVTTTPTRFSWTFTMPANAVNGAEIAIALGALLSTQTVTITGAQLEIGTVATPFERRLIGQEVSLCERYYTKLFHSILVPGPSTTAIATISYPEIMRANPIVTWLPDYASNVLSFTVDYQSFRGSRSVLVSDSAPIAGEWTGIITSNAEL